MSFLKTLISYHIRHRMSIFFQNFFKNFLHALRYSPGSSFIKRPFYSRRPLQLTLLLTFQLIACISNNISLLFLSFPIITIIGKNTSNKHSFHPLYPGGGLKLIINFIYKYLGIAIHFTNSLDFFAFSNFPFAYFLTYFLCISVISHLHPITHLSHSPSTPHIFFLL